MPVRLICQNLDNLPQTARMILSTYRERRIFAVTGRMGAGKTTLILAMCRELRVNSLTSSPSFTIVNEYCREGGDPVYHFDLYRVERVSEWYDIGCEEYLYSGHFVMIEWPEKIRELLPPDCVYIRIEDEGGGGRRSVLLETDF